MAEKPVDQGHSVGKDAEVNGVCYFPLLAGFNCLVVVGGKRQAGSSWVRLHSPDFACCLKGWTAPEGRENMMAQYFLSKDTKHMETQVRQDRGAFYPVVL